MKKIISILVLISYMLCSCGISFSFHHCGGELKYLSVNDENHEVKCCKGKKEMPEGCCQSNKVVCKKTDDGAHSIFTIIFKNTSDYNAVVEFPHLFSTGFNAILSDGNIVLYKPPPDSGIRIPLYKLHSVYRV